MAGRRNASPERLEGTVVDLASSGEAVVRGPDGVILAPGGLPGERVELVRIQRSGGTLRGEIARVIEPSPDRIEPPCPIAGRCGGCSLMHASPGLRRGVLRGMVERTLLAGGGLEVLEVVPAPEELGYRRRARLHFERRRFGYRPHRSSRIVDVERCLVLDPALTAALTQVREQLLAHLAGEGEVRLAHGGPSGDQVVIAIVSRGPQSPQAYQACERLAASAGIAGVALDAGETGTWATFGEPRERTLGADGRPLAGTIGGFSQAHGAMNQLLARRVVELSEPATARVLELYAGHGNLSVLLAPGAASFVGVESDPAAAEAARGNLAARGIAGAKVVTGDAAAHARGDRVDVVVLDPPRTGARAALAGIDERRPERIVYVSCDLATLGRDLKILHDRGYRLDAATAYEMFPQTAHAETVVRLRRPSP